MLTLDIPVVESDYLLKKLFYNFNARRSTIIFYTDENLKNLTIEFYNRFLNSQNEYKLNMPTISLNSVNELYGLSESLTQTHIMLQNLKTMPRIKEFNELTDQKNTIVMFSCWKGNTKFLLSKVNAEWYELK